MEKRTVVLRRPVQAGVELTGKEAWGLPLPPPLLLLRKQFRSAERKRSRALGGHRIDGTAKTRNYVS